MSSEKISVIVPIYKVESYLCQCIDSIINQTHQNLEILLIDDGSPDRCGEICDEYAERDDRIRVKHKKNGGVHAAWNDGLGMVTGEWVAFVDSDDWLDANYFESLLKISGSENADVIQSGGYYWEESCGQFVRWAFLEPFSATKKEERDVLKIKALLRPNDPKTKGALSYVWGKLYQKDFLKANEFRFDAQIRTGMMGDLIFNWDIFEKASLVLGTVYCGYHYRITQSSGTFKFDPKRPKTQEYVEEQLFRRIQTEESSTALYKALESRCLRDIVHNLQHCFFHPDNPASHQEVANGIRKMKQMPYYHQAIYSWDNPYNNFGLKAFQLALRLPWIWPLRLMLFVWRIIDRNEQESATRR